MPFQPFRVIVLVWGSHCISRWQVWGRHMRILCTWVFYVLSRIVNLSLSSLLSTGCLCPNDFKICEGKLHIFESNIVRMLLPSNCSLLRPRLGSAQIESSSVFTTSWAGWYSGLRWIYWVSGEETYLQLPHMTLSRPQVNFRSTFSGPSQLFFAYWFYPLNQKLSLQIVVAPLLCKRQTARFLTNSLPHHWWEA